MIRVATAVFVVLFAHEVSARKATIWASAQASLISVDRTNISVKTAPVPPIVSHQAPKEMPKLPVVPSDLREHSAVDKPLAEPFTVTLGGQLSWLQREAWPCRDAAQAAHTGDIKKALTYPWSELDITRNHGNAGRPGAQGSVIIVDAFSSKGGQMKVAVKYLRKWPDVSAEESDTSKLMFEREAEVLRALQTDPPWPSVPGFVWFGMNHDRLILVEEFVDGKDFFEQRKANRFTVASRSQLVTLFKRIIPMLGYMHKNTKHLHLDIKPENLRGRDFPGFSDVKLLDYGMSRPQPWHKKLIGELPGTTADMGVAKMRESYGNTTWASYEPLCALEDLEQLLFTAISLSSLAGFTMRKDFNDYFPDGSHQMYEVKWQILTSTSVEDFADLLSKHGGRDIEPETLELLFAFQQEIVRSREQQGEKFDYECSWVAG